MVREMSEMNYGKVARCHQYNEELISKLYFKAAEKLEDSCIKGSFFFIAYDSEKHAQVFKELAVEYGEGEFDPEDCSGYSGTAYGLRGLLVDSMDKIDNAGDEAEVLDIMEHVESVEVTMAELDRSIIANGLHNEKKRWLYNRLLKYIEEDELRHEDIINDIFKKLRK